MKNLDGNILHDEVEINLIVRYIPNGDYWRSGQLTTIKHIRLPIRLLSYDKLRDFIFELEEEIRNGLQDASSKNSG